MPDPLTRVVDVGAAAMVTTVVAYPGLEAVVAIFVGLAAGFYYTVKGLIIWAEYGDKKTKRREP